MNSQENAMRSLAAPRSLRFVCDRVRLAAAALAAAAAALLLLGAPRCALAAATAQCSSRAVLVGIGLYSQALQQGRPPADFHRRIDDLIAPQQDVEGLASVLQSRYRFAVTTLINKQATRAAILRAIRRELVDPAAPGQCLLFYFSGHGSLMRNRATGKDDETLVPADARLGVPDIRDKELGRLLREAALKGAKITALVDSCHSGSIGRELAPGSRPRQVERYPGDIYDPPGPSALAAGALTLAAAQSSQLAFEQTVAGVSHGVFTRALIQTLASSDPDLPAQLVYERLQALMQVYATREQVPILEGSELRRALALFGWQGSELSGRIEVTINRVTQRGVVELQAGFALGLEVGAELSPRDPGSSAAPRLRVTRVLGPSTSLAMVISGKGEDVQPGMTLIVDKWLPPSRPTLSVYLGSAGPPLRELTQILHGLLPLRDRGQVRWVRDPILDPPRYRLSWSGNEWRLSGPVRSQPLGKAPAAAAVLAALRSEGEGAQQVPALFVEVPLPAELAPELCAGLKKSAGRIAVAAPGGPADYALIGRADGSELEYAWQRTNQAQSERLLAPPRTDWVAVPVDASGQGQGEKLLNASAALLRLTRGLARILGWLTLTPPEQKGFPYKLALVRSGQEPGMQLPRRRLPITAPWSTLFEGEHFSARLVPQSKPLAAKSGRGRALATAEVLGLQSRYAYLFGIDSQGKSSLLVPQPDSCSNDSGPVPREAMAQRLPIDLLDGDPVVCVRPPAGIDVYILLTSERPLPNPCVLSFDGVHGRGRPAAQPSDPLSELLLYLGDDSRGIEPLTPVSVGWSIQRLPVLTRATAASRGRVSFCLER